MLLGRKLKNMRLNSSEEFSFFLEITMILGQNLFLVCESQKIFCSIRNVLENYDLGKRHKIWAKLHCPHIFLTGTPMQPINDIALKCNTICMLFECFLTLFTQMFDTVPSII